jgi:3-methyladenine DNA glycosylase/8-oxoguanine DNA glycosylase
MARWLVCADLDVRPFYGLGKRDPAMLRVINSLPGLKPIRPTTLFEMAVIAITEQQLSLAAAFHIRSRLVRSFGTPLGDAWTFPTVERLADASLQTLCACGLSRQKAGYIKDLSNAIRAGTLDIEALRSASDQQVREVLMGRPGFGQWSVDYILSRGLVRPDCLPSGDTGLQRVIGHYFSGRRLTAAELEHALAPFEPYRGLAAYYFAVHWRLMQGGKAVSG